MEYASVTRKPLTDSQRRWLDHIRAAEHSLSLSALYAWKAKLKRGGHLPDKTPDFAQMRIAPAARGCRAMCPAAQWHYPGRRRRHRTRRTRLPGTGSGPAVMMRPAHDLPAVYLCREPVDFCKSINGLASLVEGALSMDPFCEPSVCAYAS